MVRYLLLSYLPIMMACQAGNDRQPVVSSARAAAEIAALEIIDRAIALHGGDLYDAHEIQFTFRNRTYRSSRNGGKYLYERIFADSTGRLIHDRLDNHGLTRTIDGAKTALTSKDSAAYAASVNSVLYFALLPRPLRDEAVHATYVGDTDILGKTHQKLRVTFSEEGGGQDFEDEFYYWFDKTTGQLEYLAYSYATDGGGARFRAPINSTAEGGMRFVNFLNYRPDPESTYIDNIDTLYMSGMLKELSRIELEEIIVTPLSP